MFSKKLPSTSGGKFKMSGPGGLEHKLSNLTRYGQFSNLKNNRSQAISIFKDLAPLLRKNGKLSLSVRQRAARRFAALPNTTRQDERDFRKILDHYK